MLSSSSAVCTTDALQTEKYIILAPERPSKKISTNNKMKQKSRRSDASIMYRKCNHVYTTVAQKLVIESASVTVECKGKLHNQTGKGK